jgi:molybdopterin-guanine dinucleotide biosynthesis protein B
MSTPVFGITGWKNSGKTTLTERLVRNLTARGLKIATVKHAHHTFDIDREGTDSHRHRDAGAVETAIVSGKRWALMHELRDEPEPTLGDILARMSPADIVLVEGYKNGDHPKIECRRQAARDQKSLVGTIPNVVAIACEEPDQQAAGPRQFAIDDVDAIADFILDYCLA